MKYQCSVSCHCGNPSVDVDCYGTFEYCEGICTRCGASHIGRQVLISSGEHRYVTEIKHTIKSRFLYEYEMLKEMLQ